jgi:uncharacterized phage protein (TIGR02220 family)
MKDSKPAYFGILPANVRYDNRLKPMEKIMFSEITALSNTDGFCSASNAYFAGLYEKSKETVSRWINKLQEHGYVQIMITRDHNKQIIGRQIFPIAAGGIDKKINTPIDEKVKGNNTSIEYIDSQVENLTPPPKEEKYASAITQAVEYLNEKAERGFSAKRKSTQKHLRARMKEGYSLDDIKTVIDYKVAKWKDDAKMKEYLRPDTLFAGKFESYLEAAKANSEASVDQYPDDFPQRWVAIHQSYLKKSRMIYRRVAESECRLLSGPEHKSLWESKPMWWEKQVFADYLKKKHAELNEDPFLLRRYSTVYDYILDKLSEKAQTVGKLTPMVSVLQKVS